MTAACGYVNCKVEFQKFIRKSMCIVYEQTIFKVQILWQIKLKMDRPECERRTNLLKVIIFFGFEILLLTC